MSKEIRIGLFGGWRGSSFIDILRAEDAVDLIAVCDRDEDKLNIARDAGIPTFTDFETFLAYGKENGMNAMFLANFFNQHAPYAIRAMEAGMDVVSECTSASTMKECVDLVRAVERTGRKYMIAENYPFMTPHLEMNRICKGGTLGTFLYAEGEYNHSGPVEMLKDLTPYPTHWRAWMPRTYYLTHAMGPLMYMTDSMPKYVCGRAAHSDLLYQIRDFRHNHDGVGMMFCTMDNGMIARFTGCTAMVSDYGRYRVCGDRGSVESGGYLDGKVRVLYEDYTRPADVAENCRVYAPDLSSFGEGAEQAEKAGHGGGDWWIVHNMVAYFRDGVEPFFNVYRGVAMSATAILGWRSALNHGENYEVPDFSKEEVRKQYENDDATPFPDAEGKGNTVPSATWKD